MDVFRGSMRLDGALSGRDSKTKHLRAQTQCNNTMVLRIAPTRAPFVLQRVSGCPAACRPLQRRSSRPLRAASSDAADRGGGGSNGGGGGSGGGGGGDGSSNDGDAEDNNPGLSGNMWMLAGAAATVLALFLVRQKLLQKQRSPRGQPQDSAGTPSRWVAACPVILQWPQPGAVTPRMSVLCLQASFMHGRLTALPAARVLPSTPAALPDGPPPSPACPVQ